MSALSSLLIGLLLATCTVTASSLVVSGVSRATVPPNGGVPITLYGTSFPVNEPTWVVVLKGLYELTPVVSCPVDRLHSSATAAVCASLGALPESTSANVSQYQPGGSYFVGLKTTSSMQKYFFASETVTISASSVTSTVLHSIDTTFDPTLSHGIISVQISNISTSELFDHNLSPTLHLRHGVYDIKCSLPAAQSLTSAQQLNARQLSRYPFTCPTAAASGFFSAGLVTEPSQGDAVITKAAAMYAFSYDTTLQPYSVYVPPVVESVHPATVAGGSPVTITVSGNGFSTVAEENSVTLGDASCSVLSASLTQLTCRVVAGVTAPSAVTAGVTGFLHRVFSVSQSSPGSVTLPQLRATTPGGDLASGVADQSAALSLQDLDFPVGSFIDTAMSLPAAVVIEGFLKPAVSGTYRFYCSGSDAVLLRLQTGSVWSDVCSSSNSNSDPRAAMDGQPNAVSTGNSWIAGTLYKVRFSFGVSNATTAFARLAMSIDPTVRVGAPIVAVPHVVKVISPKTDGVSASFFLSVTPQVSLPVAAVSACRDAGPIDRIIASMSNGQFAVEMLVLDTTASCTWYLRFVGDSTAQPMVNVTQSTAATFTVVQQGASYWYFDKLPSYMWVSVHNTASFTTEGMVQVTVRGHLSTHRRPVNTVMPFVVSSSLSAPSACRVNQLELLSSGVSVLVSLDEDFPTTSTFVDLISYNGHYKSLGNALVEFNSTTMQFTVPSTLSASAYEVWLDLGAYGRLSCGPIIQGFQAILISPTAGSRFGGTRVTITGFNFATNFSDMTVYVGGAQCKQFYATDTTILCRSSPMLPVPTENAVSSSVNAITFFVRMFVNQTSLPASIANYSSYPMFGASLSPRFTYTLTSVPTISAVSPTSGFGSLRNILTIAGSSLTGVAFSLCVPSMLSCVPIVCPDATRSASSAICTTPRMAPDTYLVLGNSATGYANLNVNYTVVLSVTKVEPMSVSPEGGVSITIEGVGFGPSVSVMLGGSPCVVETVNATHIVCIAGPVINPTDIVPRVLLPSIGARKEAAIENATTAAVTTEFPGGDAPTVPYFYPTSGNGVGTTITIAALNFPSDTTDPEEVTVVIGSTPCKTFLVDTSDLAGFDHTLIYCNRTAAAQAGADPLRVYLGAFGLLMTSVATRDIPLVVSSYEHTLTVDSVYPLTGSTAGGTLITVTGLGFGATQFTVTMGTVACRFGTGYADTSLSVERVVCMLDANPLQTANSTVFIYITSREITNIFPSKFVFLTTSTALLTKASPLTGNAGTSISLSVIFNASDVLALLLVGVEIPLTYVPADQSFTAVLPSLPAFRSPLQVKTTTGFSRSASSIVFVSYPTISSISPKSGNTAGGTPVTIDGQRFGRVGSPDNLRVIVCGNECTLVSYTLSRIVCLLPPLRNLNTITAATVSTLTGLAGTVQGSATSGFAATLVDQDVATGVVVTRSSSGLSVTIDTGDYQSAHILRVSFFPTAGMEAALVGGSVQVSTDGASWRVVATLVTVHPGWNRLSFRATTLYAQFVRIVPSGAVSTFGIQEVSIFGVRGGATTASFCPLIVTMRPYGSDLMTTCLQQPLLCTNVDASIRITYAVAFSPTITRIQPEIGTTRGGSAINLFGSFVSVSTTEITASAGGLPCTVSSVSVNQIVCTTSAAFVDTPTAVSTTVTINGYGDASLATPPFYFAESWSSPSAWSFGELPVTGDLIIIPEGVTLVLDISPPPLAGLIIYGTLMTTGDVNINILLEAGFVLVQESGALQIGTTTNPFAASLTISLAPSTIVDPVFGSSFLAVNGGSIALCGLATSSVYGSLSQTANAGDSFVSIAGITTWSAGSSIVVPSSTSSTDETEVRTVNETRINGTNTVFYFTKPLEHTHFQGIEVNSIGLSASFTSVVGLLSRTVTVTSSDPSRRGHVAIVRSQNGKTPTVTLYYCRFSYLGQRGLARRHPLSFINVQIPSAVSMSGVSVHDSENRGIYFENSQHITSAFSVVFNTVGHGISTDSAGRSKFLTFTNNYVASVAQGETLDRDSSCFYFTTPEVSVSNSFAIGAHFAGFAYHLSLSNNETGNCPQDQPFGTFTRNTAQAADVGFTVFPAHAARTFPCGAFDPSLNPSITTTISNIQLLRNRRRHIELGNVGNWLISSCSLMDSEDAALSVAAVTTGYVTVLNTHIVAHMQRSLQTGFSTLNPEVGIRGVVFPSASGNVVLSSVFFAGYTATVGNVPHAAMSVCEECNLWTQRRIAGYTNFISGLQFVSTNRYFVFFPPYTNQIVDMDGTFNSGLQNSTHFASAAHLSGLPGCAERSVVEFSTFPFNATTFTTCPGTYSMHQVRVIGNFGGGILSVTSDDGRTNYTALPSPSFPGLEEGVVTIPSGTLNILGESYNVSRRNFVIRTGLNTQWEQMLVQVPTNLVTHGNQLGIRFEFDSPVYAVDAVARTQAFASPDLLRTELSPISLSAPTIPSFFGDWVNHSFASNVTAAFLQPQRVFISISSRPTTNGPPLTFDLTTRSCGNATCVLQAPVERSATTFVWTDVRAWPQTGRIPQAGETAIIPRGVTVTLTSATARLKALIVEGTLEFHRLLFASITANFIIINGGTIRAGSAATPYSASATINLVRDASIPPMSVSDSILIESGTLLNMGTLQLIGKPKSVPWTSLGALLGAQTVAVTTADVLDWRVDEVVAVSSSNYDDSLVEMVRIAEPASDQRGFKTRAPTLMQHDWYTMTVNDNTKLTTASKLAVLNRTIVIRSSGPTPGCQVIFAEKRLSAFGGGGVLSNAQVVGCGLRNGSKWTSTTGAAVVLQNIYRNSVQISQNAIHDSIASGIALFNSAGVTLSGNALVGTKGSSVFFDAQSSSNTVTGNLVMSTGFTEEILAAPSVPAALCSYDSRDSLNTFQNNVAAGSASEGFCVQLPSCSDTSSVNTGNEAHSCVVGHFTSHGSEVSCVAIDNFHAWHNSYIGLYSAVAASTRVTGSSLHDNHIQVLLGREGSGTNYILRSVIGGRAGYFDGLACSFTRCVSNRIFGTCPQRAELLGDGTRTFLQGEVGIFVTPFLDKTPSAVYSRGPSSLPFIRYGTSSASTTFSSIVVDNNIFYYWYRGNDFGRCGGSTTIAVDGFSTIRLPTVLLSNSSWVTFNNDAKIYIPDMVPSWSKDITMCDGHDCDALLHVLLNDLDGLFFQTQKSSNVISRYSPAARNCEEVTTWNSYHCISDPVGQLTVCDYGSSTMDSFNLEPLSVREDQHEDTVDLNFLPPRCASHPETGSDPCTSIGSRLHQFAPLLRLGYGYSMDFFVEAPRRLRLTLDSCGDPLGRVMLNVKYPFETLLTVWVYSAQDAADGYQAETLSKLILSDSPVGSHYLDTASSRLRIIMQCGYTVEVHTVAYATVAMLLQTSVEEFAYETSDSFLENVSSFLVLPSEQLSLEAVYPGSAVAVMVIRGNDQADYIPATAADQVNNYVLSLIGSDTNTISSNLGFPVLQTVAAAWASELPSTVGPGDVSFSLTTGLIIALAVVSFAIVVVVALLQYRLFLAIMSYTDDTEQPVEEEEPLADDEDAIETKQVPVVEQPIIKIDGEASLNLPSQAAPPTAPTAPPQGDSDMMMTIDVEHFTD